MKHNCEVLFFSSGKQRINVTSPLSRWISESDLEIQRNFWSTLRRRSINRHRLLTLALKFAIIWRVRWIKKKHSRVNFLSRDVSVENRKKKLLSHESNSRNGKFAMNSTWSLWFESQNNMSVLDILRSKGKRRSKLLHCHVRWEFFFADLD